MLVRRWDSKSTEHSYESIRICVGLFLVSDFLRNMNLLVSPRMNGYPEEFQEWRKPKLINHLRVSLENARTRIGQAFAIRRRLGPRCLRGNIQGIGHAFEFLYRAAFGILQCQSGCPCGTHALVGVHFRCRDTPDRNPFAFHAKMSLDEIHSLVSLAPEIP